MPFGWRSNLAEIFYIDANLVTTRPLYAYDTLTHELQHMINFNMKTVRAGRSSDAWYNEMLSMISQDLISSLISIPTNHNDHVINTSMPHFLANYHLEGFTEWNINSHSDSWIPYATKYAFGAYLVRNYGGVNLINKIMHNNQVNVASIEAALQEITPGLTFNEVLLRFSEAMMYVNPVPAGMNTFHKSTTETFNGRQYFYSGFNVWTMSRTGGTGPRFYGISEQIAIRPRSFSIHHSTANWRNVTGSRTITLERPSGSNIQFILLVR